MAGGRKYSKCVANGDDPAALVTAFPLLTHLDLAGNLVGPALTRGFGLITLYGAVLVSIIATASLFTFGRTAPARPAAGQLAPAGDDHAPDRPG